MPAPHSITAEKLARLIGQPTAPRIVDMRTDAEFARDPRLIPGARRRRFAEPAHWAPEFGGQAVVVASGDGGDIADGVAAWLRQERVPAERLEGGVAGWAAAGLPLVPEAKLPRRDSNGRTVWVTRQRPKVDRIACPWLIRRFVDPAAVFLFVPPAEVAAVAARFDATPFDVEGDGIAWSHRGDRCTFDVMVEELGLTGFPALEQLAVIVRGADTGHPEIVPEAAGLLAVSLGLSRMFADDIEQLDAGMLVYDALYRWCRDATDEVHNWSSHQPRGARPAGDGR
ncbi:chromate resistance protein ChrB domain-containing protein [Sphingoaurantiacus capsulatus]|uniref:Chromate resistance protein ChrB domain-containing protein n=1 Tax=Sphingoaurantiacus capsulatus TaxID=1771310 RepID=A0ABV7XDJ2_9SPHN